MEPPEAATPDDGILEGLAGQDVARSQATLQQLHDELAAAIADIILVRIDGGDPGRSHRRQSDELQRHGHGVGGKLATAGTGPGAGHVLELFQVGIAHAAGGIGPDGFKDLLHRHISSLKSSRHNRPAIEDQGWHVKTYDPHRTGRNGLITRHQRDHGIEHVATTDQFDGVGNDLPTDEGGLHALCAHGDGIADRHRVELHRCATGGANALLDLLRQGAQVVVAGHGPDPGVGDADDRLGQIRIAKANGLELRSCWGALLTVIECATAVSWVECHPVSSYAANIRSYTKKLVSPPIGDHVSAPIVHRPTKMLAGSGFLGGESCLIAEGIPASRRLL